MAGTSGAGRCAGGAYLGAGDLTIPAAHAGLHGSNLMPLSAFSRRRLVRPRAIGADAALKPWRALPG